MRLTLRRQGMAEVGWQGGTAGPVYLPGRQVALCLGALLVAAVLAGPAAAQNACSSGCRAAYGACYKSTHDRSRCQVQLQRCLEGCIRSRESNRRRSSLSGGAHTPSPFGRAIGHFGHAQAHFGKPFKSPTSPR
jgi:hypothetical protein